MPSNREHPAWSVASIGQLVTGAWDGGLRYPQIGRVAGVLAHECLLVEWYENWQQGIPLEGELRIERTASAFFRNLRILPPESKWAEAERIRAVIERIERLENQQQISDEEQKELDDLVGSLPEIVTYFRNPVDLGLALELETLSRSLSSQGRLDAAVYLLRANGGR